MEVKETVKLLKEFGLNSYEAKAYVALLKLGRAPATEVAKESGIPPQRVYDSLKSLEEKGFVYVLNGKPKLYVPASVRDALLGRIYQMKTEFEKRERFLRELIGEIEANLSKFEEKKEGDEKEVFSLEGEKALISKALNTISQAKKTVWIAGVKPLFKFGCRGNLDRYLPAGVELVAIGKFDTPCKEEIKKLGGKFLEKEVEIPYLLIVDGKKLLQIYAPNKGLYTENPLVVAPFISYFQSLLS